MKNLINNKSIFILTLLAILSTYLYLFGKEKTIEMVTNEYLLFLAIVPMLSALVFLRIKLKDFEIIDFLPNNQLSLKSSISFFLIFQVVDYFYEDGFIGMISQWFLYWIYSILALLLMQLINYYKNYKMIKLV